MREYIDKNELIQRWETDESEVEKIAGMGFLHGLEQSGETVYSFPEVLVAEMKANQDLPEKLRTVQDGQRLGMTGERFDDFKRNTLLEITGHAKKPYFNTLFNYYLEAING